MILTMQNLGKEYKGRKVVDIQDFTMDCNGLTAIIGPNGAGKSTLINMIAGLESVTSGVIKYNGKTEIPYKDITLVFQKPYLISGTVEMNIKYPMKLRKQNKETVYRTTEKLLRELGLLEYRKQKSWTLSGGETQKVALARALAVEPKLLILDEPTASIDPATTADIEQILITTSQTDNINILVVTHNIAQAKRLCDKIIFIHQGKIIEYGKTDDVLNHPQNELTEKFIHGEIII